MNITFEQRLYGDGRWYIGIYFREEGFPIFNYFNPYAKVLNNCRVDINGHGIANIYDFEFDIGNIILKTHGVAISTNIPYDEALLDSTSIKFSNTAAAVEKKIRSFLNDLGYIEKVAVKEFIAVVSQRQKRSGGPSTDVTVGIGVEGESSEVAEGSVLKVQQKLNRQISSGIANDDDVNSLLSGATVTVDYCDEFGTGNDCPTDSTCNRTPTAKFCSCNTGFQMVLNKCEATSDVCDNNGGCSQFADCRALGGEVSCECKAGFHGDGITCRRDSSDIARGAELMEYGKAKAFCKS